MRPTRRNVLQSTAAAITGAGCSTASAATRGACFHDCPDTCAWTVVSSQGKLVRIEADPKHPITRGELCPRMEHYLEDIVYSPDRLLYPLRRTGAKGDGKFERVSWETAIGEVAARLQQIIREHGGTAILPYSFAGTEGVVQMGSLSDRFFARIGASRLERNICGSAGSEGVKATLGTTLGVLPNDVVHSRYIVLWGTNPADTSPHSWRFVEEARRRGARIVTIDPQRTPTAAGSDWHLQPLPGTDAALALGLMHVLVQENLFDTEFVANHTLGFDKLRARVAEYTPVRAAAITGLKPEQIQQLAREYARAGVSTIRLLIGMEHRANGAMAFRAISCLPALTGAWRHRGGGLNYMSYELFGLNFDAVNMPQLEDKKLRSINMVQLGRALTNKELKPAIHGLVVYNSNPATIAPNQNQVLAGLRRPDLFTVVVEQFLTDTARHADFVFPAATQVELLDLQASWGHQFVALNLPAAAPAGEAVPNTEFIRRLARAMGLTESWLYDSDEQLVRAALQTQDPRLKGITFERLRSEGWAPVQIPDPWIPFAAGKFPTPSGKCEFYSETWAKAGLDPLPTYTAVPDRDGGAYPLRLLTSKSARQFLNSSHAGVARAAREQGRPFVQMHPADAAARGIQDGDLVRLFNERGAVVAPVQFQPALLAGVAAMSHGWWASRMPNQSSANALTRDGLSDTGGGGDFNDTRIQIAKA